VAIVHDMSEHPYNLEKARAFELPAYIAQDERASLIGFSLARVDEAPDFVEAHLVDLATVEGPSPIAMSVRTWPLRPHPGVRIESHGVEFINNLEATARVRRDRAELVEEIRSAAIEDVSILVDGIAYEAERRQVDGYTLIEIPLADRGHMITWVQPGGYADTSLVMGPRE
jgi:hypothetical protein